MLSLVELSRAARALAARIEGHRLREVGQPDAERVVLSTWGPAAEREGRKHHVLLSCGPETARVSLLERPPPGLPRPPAFTQYLRAHVVGAAIVRVEQVGDDRLLAVDLEGREGSARLLLSIFGRRSNVFLMDGEGRVAAALRPLDATRPELALGEPWRAPASRPPSAGEDRFADVPEARLLEAIEAHYGVAEAEGAQAELRRRIEHSLRKEERRLERKLEKIERELGEAQAAASLARDGELLKGALPKVRRGDREVVVRDHEKGEDVTIVLDPTLAPAQNLESIFKRYRKAVRRLTKGGAQDVAVRDAHREVRVLADEFAAVADDEEALGHFATRDAVVRVLARHERTAPAPRARAPEPREVKIGRHVVPRRLLPRRYRTAGDLEIWVGRNDQSNDLLSTRLARGKDLFFHLDGAPGSHVVLRTGGRNDPPSEAILDACELAVHFSKAKKATRADVHVVPIKNVRKPKGAKPGLVTVHGGKTIHLRRNPTRLSRLLAGEGDAADVPAG